MSMGLFSNKLFLKLILLSFNTDRPVKILMVITLVVQEINFFYRNSGMWRLGMGKVVSGSTEFCTFSCC